MAAELIVIGPTTGSAYSYARARFGNEAPARCFVPVAPFSLGMFAHETRKGSVPLIVVLPGSERRDDWEAWKSILTAVKPAKVEYL